MALSPRSMEKDARFPLFSDRFGQPLPFDLQTTLAGRSRGRRLEGRSSSADVDVLVDIIIILIIIIVLYSVTQYCYSYLCE